MIKIFFGLETIQAEKMIEACRILLKSRTISKDEILFLAETIFSIQDENYKSGTRSKEEVLKMINLTP